jgi:hypothetical protein
VSVFVYAPTQITVVSPLYLMAMCVCVCVCVCVCLHEQHPSFSPIPNTALHVCVCVYVCVCLHEQGASLSFIWWTEADDEGSDVIPRAFPHAFFDNVVGQLGEVVGLGVCVCVCVCVCESVCV